MPTFAGSCQGIRQLEGIVVGTKQADCLNDGGKPFSAFGVVGHKSAVYSRLYELYLNKGMIKLFSDSVMIRFSYDERVGNAECKISRSGMERLIRYMPTLIKDAIAEIHDVTEKPDKT